MITGPLARAARALIQLPRAEVAHMAGVSEATLQAFETGASTLSDSEQVSLRTALETGGATFVPESKSGGVGVRLKFTDRDVRAINRLEGEGGPPADDDV
jgi:DNA-binding XRE family transcriptional regulator